MMKPRPTAKTFGPESDAFRSDIQHQQDPLDPLGPVNIHHDPRIVRGSTFGGNRIDTSAEQPAKLKTKGKPRSRMRCGRLRDPSSLFETAAPGQHSLREELDFSRHLIDPRDAVVRLHLQAGTHTDDFKERPQTPDYIPKKTGVDISTQLGALGKLFDWNREIQPLLDVLVGKTLDQARVEVEREHELECIAREAATLKRHREDEASRIAKLDEAALLAERENEALRRRQREAARQRRSTKEKVASLQLVRQVLPLSLESAFEELERKSWITPIVYQMKIQFLPWLFERVAAEVDKSFSASEVVESLFHEAKERAAAALADRVESTLRELEAAEKAARTARDRVIDLFVPAELVGGEVGQRFGPISVRAGETVTAVEQRVIGWLEAGGRVEEVTAPEGGFLAGYLREARKRSRGIRLAKGSLLMELQEVMGVSNDVLLQAAFDD